MKSFPGLLGCRYPPMQITCWSPPDQKEIYMAAHESDHHKGLNWLYSLRSPFFITLSMLSSPQMYYSRPLPSTFSKSIGYILNPGNLSGLGKVALSSSRRLSSAQREKTQPFRCEGVRVKAQVGQKKFSQIQNLEREKKRSQNEGAKGKSRA